MERVRPRATGASPLQRFEPRFERDGNIVGFRRALHTGTKVAALAVAAIVAVGPTSHASARPSATPVPPSTVAPTTAPVDETSADTGNFAVQPSGPNGPGGRDYFIYTLKSGQLFGDTVGVSNLGTTTATFVVYATDARTTNDGSFSLMREEEKAKDVGTWITLGATQYTLEPGKRVDIPFKLAIPADATPGDHVGAIVAQRVDDPKNPGSGIGLDVRVRVGARLYVRVDGPLNPSLAVESMSVRYDSPGNPFGSADAHIDYTLTNTGDVRLSPTAALRLSGLFGLGEQKLPDRQIPELLPGSSIQIAETVHGVKPFGRLTTHLVVQQPGQPVMVRASVVEWAIPWLGVLVIALLIVGIIGQRVWARRRNAGA
jgi:hypothetical protein